MLAMPESALHSLQQHVADFARRTDQRLKALEAVIPSSFQPVSLHSWEESLLGLQEHAKRARDFAQASEEELAAAESSLAALLEQGTALLGEMQSFPARVGPERTGMIRE